MSSVDCQKPFTADSGVSTLYKCLQEGETDLGRPLTRELIEASVAAKPLCQEVATLSDHELEALIQEAGYVKVGVR